MNIVPTGNKISSSLTFCAAIASFCLLLTAGGAARGETAEFGQCYAR